MGLYGPDVLDRELSQVGALRLLEKGEPKQAALLTYQWLLKETMPGGRLDDHNTPNLYDMLSYLLERGTMFGFTYESRIEKGGIVFTITNNKLQKSRVIPILLELLIARICEQLCNAESQITQSKNKTIVKIKLP